MLTEIHTAHLLINNSHNCVSLERVCGFCVRTPRAILHISVHNISILAYLMYIHLCLFTLHAGELVQGRTVLSIPRHASGQHIIARGKRQLGEAHQRLW